MDKIQKKQRLREFIDPHPRGIITRLAEHVGVSTVSVHNWLDDKKGWMTRKNERLVEEFIKQQTQVETTTVSAPQPPAPAENPTNLEELAFDLLSMVQKSMSKGKFFEVVKRLGQLQDEPK